MDILEKITALRLEREWSEYQLAERSGLTQSTISSWYRKGLVPSVSSLSCICDAFGISLSQFFSDSKEAAQEPLTAKQKAVLTLWSRLSPAQQKKLSDFLNEMLK